MCFDYQSIIVGITKSEAIHLLRNADLSGKKGIIIKPNLFYRVQKMNKVFLDMSILKNCEQKMVSNSSARYYRKSKERFKKRLVKGIKIFVINKKKKSDNMVASDIKKGRLIREKNVTNVEKRFVIKGWLLRCWFEPLFW